MRRVIFYVLCEICHMRCVKRTLLNRIKTIKILEVQSKTFPNYWGVGGDLILTPSDYFL